MSHTLAIDLGTGSCRALVFDLDGRPVATSQREWSHPPIPGVPGSQSFDTSRNWPLIATCVREAIQLSGLQAGDIKAVSATSMREGMVLYDAAGQEIWAGPNVDSRASSQADELVQSGLADRIFAVAGDWVSITSPARFRWIRDNEPEIFGAIAHMGMLSDWVLYRLTGRFVTDPSAGSSSNLFNLADRTWSADVLDWVGLPASIVPEVLESGSLVGGVTAQAATETGLAAGTPVIVGGADTQLGLVGIGMAAPGQLALLGGSFWQLTVTTDRPLIDPQARVRTLCHTVPGQWMTEGIGFYCGIVMRWFRDAFCEVERTEAARRGIDAYSVMEELAASVPPGANGLVAIFSNVMNARRWVQASPTFVGFDVDDPAATGRAACIRAIQEQAAFATRVHLKIIEELTGTTYDELIFTGGAARGSLWPQIVADVTGLRVRVASVPESTALGAAIFAGIGAGLYRDLPEALARIVRLDDPIEPDPANVATYADLFERWSAIYSQVLELSEVGLARPMWWPAGASPRS